MTARRPLPPEDQVPDQTPDPEPPRGAAAKSAERSRILAERLRANLHRRKVQSRARRERDGDGDGCGGQG